MVGMFECVLELLFIKRTEAKASAKQSYAFYLLGATVWYLSSNLFLTKSFVTFLYELPKM